MGDGSGAERDKHSHRSVSDTMLLHFAPGAPREGHVERLPELGDAGEEERAEFFLRHDTFWR